MLIYMERWGGEGCTEGNEGSVAKKHFERVLCEKKKETHTRNSLREMTLNQINAL